jgi:type II secretory pathway pseudopilin PulG
MPTGRRTSSARARHRRRRGLIYLALLWLLAATGGLLALFGESWTRSAQRERERELISRGEQIRIAIDRYRRAVATRSEWPKSLDDLVEDRRQDEPRYHLRRRFEDPFGPAEGWGEIRDPTGGLIGVHTRSNLQAVGRWAPEPGQPGRNGPLNEWRFVVVEGIETGAAAPAPQRSGNAVPTMRLPR